jgi:hypothetical protein
MSAGAGAAILLVDDDEAVRTLCRRGLEERSVPRVGMILKPDTGRLGFYRAIRKASAETVTPYDLRRSYSEFLDIARIPGFRQDYYMAHGPKDLGAHYKKAKECEAYLLEDGAALEKAVSEPLGLRIVR